MTPEKCLAEALRGVVRGQSGLTLRGHAHWSDMLLVAVAVARMLLPGLALSLWPAWQGQQNMCHCLKLAGG